MSCMSREVSARWITSRNFDLLWFIGPCLTGYALIYMNAGLGISALLLFWLWIFLLDGPHVFATISRTYLDKEEWRHRSKLLFQSMLTFLPGPLIILISIIIGSSIPFVAFLTLA